MVQSWQFIYSVQANGRLDDPETRKMVRTNAMRAFRRRERLRMVKELQYKQFEAQAQSQNQAKEDSQLVLESSNTNSNEVVWRSYANPEIPSTEVGVGHGKSLDIGSSIAFGPFSSTAQHSHHDAPKLFSHFVNVIGPTIQPFGSAVAHNPISKVWAQQALSDPVVLGAVLFHAAVHLDLGHGRPWSPMTLYHRGQSIRLIKQHLEHAKDVMSDNIIGAVSLFSAAGNITGDVNDDFLHRKALQTMVRMRGGLQNLGWVGALAMVLSIGDAIAATISISEPFMERPYPDTATIALLGALDNPQIFAGPSKLSSDLPSLRAEVHTLIGIIAKLAQLFSNSYGTLTTTTANMIAFNQICSMVEYRLLSIRNSAQIRTSSQTPDFFIYDASCAAGLMCMTYLFRQMKLEGFFFTSLEKSFRASLISLETLENAVASETSLRLLLWATCIGGMTSIDQSWFAVRIRHCMSSLKIGSREELELCLLNYIWTPKMCDYRFLALWREVRDIH